MLIEELIYEVELPEGVTFSIDNDKAKLNGPGVVADEAFAVIDNVGLIVAIYFCFKY